MRGGTHSQACRGTHGLVRSLYAARVIERAAAPEARGRNGGLRHHDDASPPTRPSPPRVDTPPACCARSLETKPQTTRRRAMISCRRSATRLRPRSTRSPRAARRRAAATRRRRRTLASSARRSARCSSSSRGRRVAVAVTHWGFRFPRLVGHPSGARGCGGVMRLAGSSRSGAGDGA